MEFQEFWKDKERMCDWQMKQYKCCCPNGKHAWTHELDCPITKLGSSINTYSCSEIIGRHPEEAEKIVKDWVKSRCVEEKDLTEKIDEIKKYESKYGTRLGVHFWIVEDKIILRKDEEGGGNKRDMTEEEMDQLISKYRQLDEYADKLTDETHILF